MKKFIAVILFSFTIPLWGSMQFDGTNDYVTIPDINESVTTLSVFAWVKGSTAQSQRFMTSHWYGATSNQRSWAMTTANTTWSAAGTPDGNEFAVIISSDGSIVFGNYKAYWIDRNIMDGIWHHLGFTWNAGTLTLYIDGQTATTQKDADPTISVVHNSTVAVHINGNAGFGSFFAGDIDDVRVYSRVLSANEIRSLAAPVRKPCSSLDRCIGYWRLDEGVHGTVTTGAITRDLSGSGNHGTVANESTWKAGALSYP